VPSLSSTVRRTIKSMVMQQQKTSQLYDKHSAIAFYQERYAHGYMDEWPIEKKRRIFEVIRSFELPDAGEALDFGCGNGVFTDVIKQALPLGWKVYGVDISEIAIENAKKRYPGGVFFVADDREIISKRFDFLFTHHVLEHVYNLPQVLKEINDRMKDESTILHILPCGNEGSFEHSICLLRKDGINLQLEHRFFFEDEGHLRRLTTEQLSKLCREKGFILAKEYYSNQYYGAINWITQSGPSFVRMFTDLSSAVDEEAKGKLTKIRYKLFFLWCLRYPAAFVESRLRKRNRPVRDYIFLILGFLLYVFTKSMDNYLKRKALNEWNKRKTERNGSEMYLFFKR
jgi:SAM-dependent methyltransferase